MILGRLDSNLSAQLDWDYTHSIDLITVIKRSYVYQLISHAHLEDYHGSNPISSKRGLLTIFSPLLVVYVLGVFMKPPAGKLCLPSVLSSADKPKWDNYSRGNMCTTEQRQISGQRHLAGVNNIYLPYGEI